jgi:hypothetical protein
MGGGSLNRGHVEGVGLALHHGKYEVVRHYYINQHTRGDVSGVFVRGEAVGHAQFAGS